MIGQGLAFEDAPALAASTRAVLPRLRVHCVDACGNRTATLPAGTSGLELRASVCLVCGNLTAKTCLLRLLAGSLLPYLPCLRQPRSSPACWGLRPGGMCSYWSCLWQPYPSPTYRVSGLEHEG